MAVLTMALLNYGSLLVVVVYRHGENAGTLRLLTGVEARHVRVLERLLDVGHMVSEIHSNHSNQSHSR